MSVILSLSLVADALPALGDGHPTPPPNPFPTPPPRVFCFRVTDLEAAPGNPSAFYFQFQFINWSNQPAHGAYIWLNEGTTTAVGGPPTITDAGVDPDGRGGDLGGSDIGTAVFNSPAHHSGRGRQDIPGHLNDWGVVFRGDTSVFFGGEPGQFTPIPFRSILTAPSSAAQYALVPGLGNDGLLTPDSALDGGPLPYGPPTQPAPFPAGGQPTPDGSGNVLDGFWIKVEDFDVGEVLSFNWMLTDANGESIGQVGTQGNVVGNWMAFGVFNVARVPLGSSMPPGLFLGNSGFAQGMNFFQNVYRVPDVGGVWGQQAEFGVEFGPGLLAPPLSPTVAEEVPPTVHPSISVPNIDPEVVPTNAWPAPCLIATPADVNQNGVVNVSDVVCIILMATYELGGSQGAPPACFSAPRSVGDLNCNDVIDVSDAQLAVYYAFDVPLPYAVDGNNNRCHDSCECSAALCDDGNGCTVNLCDWNGGCQTTPFDCNDGDPCTIDSCDPAVGCVFTPVGCGGGPGCTVADGTPCDDGSVCTEGDMCSGGSCVGTPIDCDDANPCTTHTCDPAAGCIRTNLPDGTPCPGGFQCVQGFCVQPENCTTDAGCTSFNDACQTFSCVNTDTPGVNLCSVTSQTNCDDGNQCTDDGCDPVLGCQNVNDDTNECTDGDVCTTGDECVAGACVGTGGLCDDGNPCTVDFCSSNTGCFATPLHDVPCDDGSVCTLDDTCVQGFCVGTPKVCDDGDVCTVNSCHPVDDCRFDPIDCEDNNPCTDNLCDPALGCQVIPNTDPCDDGSVCTQGDQCSAGACVGTPIDCDDGVDCTLDTCHPTQGCQHAPSHALCNDGVACSTAVCSPTQGCQITYNDALCDDGNLCTLGQCTPFGCQFPNNDGPCDDGDVCTVGDACIGGVCVPGPNLCAFGNLVGSEFCHVAGEANDLFQCQVRVARATLSAPPAAGLQFRVVNPDPARIDIESLVAEVCSGPCATVPLPGALDTGHAVSVFPTSFTQWNGPSGGTAIVYDFSNSPPAPLTTAHVDGLGNPVGDAVVMTLRVRVKASIDAAEPVKLSYSDVAASTTQAAEMVTQVKLGTIVVDYPCPLPLQDADGDGLPETCPVCEGAACLELDDVFCFVSGTAGQAVSCPLRVARRSAGSPPIGGVQVRLGWPTDAPLEVDGLYSDLCFAPGMCVEAVFPPPPGQSYPLSSGHQVATEPVDAATWAALGGASVLVYGASGLESVSDAHLDPAGATQGEDEVLRLALTLTGDVPPSAPLRLRLHDLSATSALGHDLEAVAAQGRVVVGAPRTRVYCEAFGPAQSTTTCTLRFARQSANVPAVGGLQLALPLYDPARLQVVSLTAVSCDAMGFCFEKLMPQPLDAGHQVAMLPQSFSQWAAAGGGGVLVYGGGASPTPAVLNSAGQMIGNPELMRLRVRLLEPVDSSAPLLLAYGPLSASTVSGVDLETRVLGGVVVAAEPPTDVLCEVSGAAGQLVSCPIRLARANAGVPLVAGLQFALRVDNPGLVEVVRLSAEVCPPVGACASAVMPQPLGTGHLVNLLPASYSTWAVTGQGQVLLFGGTTQSLTDAVLGAGGAITGASEFMRLELRLLQAIPPGAPERIRITPGGASDPSGYDLHTSLFNSVLIAE